MAHALLEAWTNPLGAPAFDEVAATDFLPAFEVAIAENRAELAAIADDPAPADFDNVMAALERSGERLGRIRRLFWTLSSAQANEGIRAIEADVSALLTAHGTAVSHDPKLFARVAAVWETRDTAGLTPEQRRLVENSYKGFVRGGAALSPADKARFGEIDQRLGQLSVRFGQNVLAATMAWEMLLDADELDGLPPATRSAAAARAARKGHAGRYLFTLDRGDYETVLTFAARRDVRERMWRGFTGRCDGDAQDNNPLIAEIVALRTESARLLGYATFADYKLDDSMAARPEAAEALMLRVWAPARRRALEEQAELQRLVEADGGGFLLAAWDWRYYAERVRCERYALDGAAFAEHLTLESVRAAAFGAAGKLYGLRFEARPDLPVYHPDVSAWGVTDAAGAPVGLIYTDYLARTEKHGGAWMGSLRTQERMDGDVRPIVYTVANFTRGADGADAHLSVDEARTLFHEFGHALHALLSNVTYPSLAGTSVARDFVEFPSKFMEHWIIAPEVLRGFDVPDALIVALGRADTYGQGFATVEFLASAFVDLALHREAPGDVAGFERVVLDRLGCPPVIGMRHRLPYFTHVFDGGYASAYYSYLWSEVLDADAFGAFEEGGGIFDADPARRFRDEILARGDSRDPMDSFVAFRGRGPDEGALLRARGLAA
ncbi:M3 family metallopeptidase [Sphingomonas solaris]|uniref:M3 family metallopeptidase n=1 Tax=Alterirhizorhabdus solaris TaxID=2529389 RepID=A0A558R3T6_9SPHN|nr:M3 family metallopeptidase [Sphingomonas solaris]TVV74055.1 M3 family metallopeptidase [Sphingomonas solaris]